MADNLYITATEARSGKSAVALGVMEMLLARINKVGFFRPIISPNGSGTDRDIELITTLYGLDASYEEMYAYTFEEAKAMMTSGDTTEVIEGILNKYTRLKEKYDFVLCEGTDYTEWTTSFEFDFNAEIAKNLNSPVMLVANAYQRSIESAIRDIELTLSSLKSLGCSMVATIVNRIEEEEKTRLLDLLKNRPLLKDQLIYAVPNEQALGSPTVGEIARALDARVLYGADQLDRNVHKFIVAAMQLRNLLRRIEHGSLIITPGDRADVIVACLAIVSSMSMQNIAGIVLTGGLVPEEPVTKLIKGFSRMVPILSVREDTFPTATMVEKVHAAIEPGNQRKVTRALALFEKNIKVRELAEKIITTHSRIVTPKMFEFNLLQRARGQKQRIVLPEGEEERILRATETLLRRNVVDVVLLGDKEIIERRISLLGLRVNGLTIINPQESDVFEDYVQTYFDLRKHKGITMDNARDTMSDVSYYGTMMVYKGHADGMVSGAVHSTAHTIVPSFEIIKTRPGYSIVSSVFFMCLADRVLVYGDCAVNPNPTAPQLAEIALNSAQTAQTFGIEPYVAMLSYSTGESGTGADVTLVKEATEIAKKMAAETDPHLKIEGPIQYDAAVDMAVAKTKMPDSEVAGKATVFIFPDLNTGNNTYKAVQRTAGAVAIGPIMQGLKKPVNDLSRGCTVTDIVNTVAITAIQAQTKKRYA